jgi:hypothetical protein
MVKFLAIPRTLLTSPNSPLLQSPLVHSYDSAPSHPSESPPFSLLPREDSFEYRSERDDLTFLFNFSATNTERWPVYSIGGMILGKLIWKVESEVDVSELRINFKGRFTTG